MSTVSATCQTAAAPREEVGNVGPELIAGANPRVERGLCQERKSDSIPLDNFYSYPLYSEGFSTCGHARPKEMGGVL